MSSSKVAIVTGAGSGIGRAVALALSNQGFRLVLVGRTEASLQQTAATLDDPVLLVGDVRDQALIDGFLGLSLTATTIVHCAMPVLPMAKAPDVTAERLDQAMKMVTAAGLWTAAVVPGMRAASWGRIVFLGSKAADLGGPGQMAYAASKSALVGMMRTLAVELGAHGVTSNLLSVGFVQTARTDRFSDAVKAKIIANSVVGRPGTPTEVASMVGYLCSSDAGFVTGAVLDVSGGAGLGPFGGR